MSDNLEKRRNNGDFVECGPHRSGAAAAIAAILAEEKNVLCYNSFEGMLITRDLDGTEAGKCLVNVWLACNM